MINRYLCMAFWCLLFLGIGSHGQAQVITWTPTFPTLDDSVVITFNAAEGNGALNNTSATVYGHFGLVVAGPNSETWTRTVGNWGTADPRVQMTRLGNNLFQIGFVPRRFFGNVPATVTGYRIGMVFRNTDGSTVGRSAANGDIFMPLYQAGQLAVRITTPGDKVYFMNQGGSLQLKAEASMASSLVLELNGATVATANGTQVTYDFTGTAPGPYKVRAGVSGFAGVDYLDSATVVVRGDARREPIPAGWKLGPNYLSPTSVGLVLAAPNKAFGYVLGDFNNWDFDTASFMRRTPDGNYLWVQLNNLNAGQSYSYQFFLDGNLKVADPLAELVLDPSNDRFLGPAIFPNMPAYPTGKATGVVSVIQPGRAPYQWRYNRPAPPEKTKMFVYELHLRDFLGRAQDKTFQGLLDTLPYLEKLGINVIELMPVSEFEGNNSWGYNPSFHGAVDKAYGPPDKLRELVDSCHGRGILVVLDVVYNHAFSFSPLVQMYPLSNSPYANATARHPFNVGTDLNHESPYTREYVNRCNQRWLEEFRIDGFRFDLSKGLTQKNTGNVDAWGQYDASRIANLTVYLNAIRQSYADAVVILEHFAATQEERELTNLGFFTWGNMTGAYREAAKGASSSSDLGGTYYTRRGLSVPNAIIYMESHDEERIVYDVIREGRQWAGYNTRDSITAYDRMKLAAVFFFAIPGPKMIWQFGELGYPYSINTCPNGTVGACRVDPKPVRWSYVRNPYRQSIYKVYQNMMNLVKTVPAFHSPTNVLMTVNGIVRRVELPHPTGNVLVIGNFSGLPQTVNSGLSAGRWYEFFTADSLQSGGVTDQITLQPGEYRIYSQQRLYNPGPGLTLDVDDELALPEALAYPNPTTGRLTVATTSPARLEDMQGRLLQTARPVAGQARLDLSALAPGLYLVRTGTQVQRVVKR